MSGRRESRLQGSEEPAHRSSPVVWDVPTRVLHWALALAIVLNLFVLEEGDLPHTVVGTGACGVVALRVVWGFVARNASRLSAFPARPREVASFLGALARGSHPPFPGHNPAAALNALGLWSTVLALGVTGWMQSLDAFFGEDWLEELHGGLAVGLGVFVGTHLVGIALDAFVHRRRTWWAMVTGRRLPWRPRRVPLESQRSRAP